MRLTCRFLLCLVACAVAIHLSAGEQSIPFSPSPVSADFGQPGRDQSLFLNRFESAFEHRANDQFADRFLAASELKRHRLQVAESTAKASADTSKAMMDSISSSARDAALELPVMHWFDERQGIVADFIRSALWTSGEESIAPMSLSSGYVERSWWKQLADSDNLVYGLRPFRTDPYAFLSFRFKDGNTVLALAHARYHYRQFADHNFELALSVPLASHCSLDFGTTYQFGRHDEQKKLAVKFIKELKNGGCVQGGLRLQRSPEVFLGMSLPL